MRARIATAGVCTSLLVMFAAACGGGQPAGPPAASAQQSGAIAFARCMRSHGVRSWPDPESSGVFDKSELTLQRLRVSGSRLQAAQNACRRLLPGGGGGPSPAQVRQMKAQALAFSRCVRNHGVPSFPDPGSDGRIPDPAAVGIDQGSPKFEAANQSCRRYRPPYIPSNAAYDAWARTHSSGS
jgi:hypothetical protein